ncbi:hypothetical protein B0J17DRAFT_636947 [Rhizoctonia solani]|nr:hypothetical protein B0J17DRAFT_636947 [Rhizoctonia solani]
MTQIRDLMECVGRRAARTSENMSTASIKLGEQDLEEIRRIMEQNPVSGDRYNEGAMQSVWG